MWKNQAPQPPLVSMKLEVPGCGRVGITEHATGKRYLAQMDLDCSLFSAHRATLEEAQAAGAAMAAVMPEIARLLAEALAPAPTTQEALPLAEVETCHLHGPKTRAGGAYVCLPCAAGIR